MTIHDRLLHVLYRNTASLPENAGARTGARPPRAPRRAPWTLLVALALLATVAWAAFLAWLVIRAAGIL